MNGLEHLSPAEVRATLTQSKVRELLDYDHASGSLTWRPRPERTYHDARWNRRFAGKVAGRVYPDGYLRFTLMGVPVIAHRLIWLYVHGEWPSGVIDHRDGNPINNRLSNLRLASVRDNTANSKKRAGTSSRFKGVTWVKTHQKWKAAIEERREVRFLGYFETEEAAHAAYCVAARRAYGEFFRPE